MCAQGKNKHLIVVMGPTAVGKTRFGVKLAKHFGTEVISADARQCYRGMAIGTAQPTDEEKEGVPHHLVGFLPVQAAYSAGQFARDALRILEGVFKKHDYAVLVGGSGLYIQAVCEGLDEMPVVDSSVVAYLNKRWQEEGLSVLVQELSVRDPVYHARVDVHNPHRVIRALAICLATGERYSDFRKRAPQERYFSVSKIGLVLDREVLYERIRKRVKDMFACGLVEEVESLYAYRGCNALRTVGYREVFGYLEGRYRLEEAMELVVRNTRRYAKRQMTWLREEDERDVAWVVGGMKIA
ncbi:MAG: tRNA (adenosine(37)-N6)-dimethylallyltransferase MiaA [Bacteroidota bacterium]